MSIATKRKTTTSSEVKQRWENANYKKYLVRFRNDIDKDLIKFIEGQKQNGKETTEIFRDALTYEIEKNDGL